MHRSLIAALPLAVALALPAQAAEPLPARKPGLWEINMVREGSPMPASTSQMCIDASTDAALMNAGLTASKDMCDAPSLSGSGNTRVYDTVCRMMGSTLTGHTVVTYASPAAYHVDSKTLYAPPLNGKTESHMTQDAKWVGACPADLQPGEMLINGMKVNVLGTMGAAK